MAVTQVGTPTTSSDAGVSVLSWSYTNTTATDLLVVGVGVGNAGASVSCTSVTYNGDSLTELGTFGANDGNFCRVQLWYRNGASTALATGANTVLVTCGAQAEKLGAGVSSYTGFNTSTPFGTPTTSNSQVSNPATVSASLASGDLGYSTICSDSETLAQDGTLIWEIEGIGSDVSVGAQTKTGTGSTAFSWTLNASVGGAVGAVAIQTAGGGQSNAPRAMFHLTQQGIS